MNETQALLAQLEAGLGRLLQDRGLGSLLALVEQRGGRLVGGLVRDLCLGRPVQDVDVVVPSGAERLCRRLRQIHGGTVVPLDDERGIVRLVLSPDLYLDVADFQGESLEEDLGRRDFTLNAMALPPSGPASALIDPHGGLQDLAARVLRMVGPQSFSSDPLRILRAARLGARLGLEVEAQTFGAMEQAVPQLAGTARERIHAELEMLLEMRSALPWLEQLQGLGVFRLLLEASGLVSAAPAQAGGPAGRLSALGRVWAGAHDRQPGDGTPGRLPLLWAALLQDLAGDALDGRQAAELFAHLRVPSRIGKSAAAVYTGPRALQAAQEPAALVRALLALGSEARGAVLLAQALGRPWAGQALATYRDRLAPLEGETSLVTGKDLLRAGLRAGPRIGQLLEEIEVRRRLGLLRSAPEAVAWALSEGAPGKDCHS